MSQTLLSPRSTEFANAVRKEPTIGIGNWRQRAIAERRQEVLKSIDLHKLDH